ncbi:MAG TPA: HD domain-containing phosphohydrolase [Longimicrobium sp.]|jgi:putative nucleotidyltransferase with HDIG domain|uniref:HD-GYP domain-containing protein n=1 Tax=Longimicrobium sp. TaxID=2029185 RepID=UPI002EDB55D2
MAKETVSRAPLGIALVTVGACMGIAWALDASARERRLAEMHRDMVDLLLNALSAGDPVTARHSRRVADLSYAVAVASGMADGELRTLRVAALLHDMGKIDDRFFHIVHSRQKLTPEQRAEIKNHPHESAHILAPLESMHPGIQEIVSSHHECWDGSGYPNGRAGEDIPLGARIIALADAFDAMTQPRKYREAMPVDKALGELSKGSGSQFDPRLVRLAATPDVRETWEQVVERDLFAERCALDGVTE